VKAEEVTRRTEAGFERMDQSRSRSLRRRERRGRGREGERGGGRERWREKETEKERERKGEIERGREIERGGERDGGRERWREGAGERVERGGRPKGQKARCRGRASIRNTCASSHTGRSGRQSPCGVGWSSDVQRPEVAVDGAGPASQVIPRRSGRSLVQKRSDR